MPSAIRTRLDRLNVPGILAGLLVPLMGCHSPAGPSGPSLLLTANVVAPSSVNAVSQFNSCAGHAFPYASPNSAKNYFWPNSTNFSTTSQLEEFAACDGMIGQNSDDTDPNEQDRGRTFHLYCDHSSTMVRYFHLNLRDGLLGQHVRAADALGYASMVGTGQAPSAAWQYSSNFDIAVSDGDDSSTENYFAKLDAAAFAAWASRGLTAVSQTINPGNPTCASFGSSIGSPDVFTLTPVL